MADQTLLAQGARNILLAAAMADVGVIVEVLDPSGTVIAPALRAKQVLYRFKSEDADFSNIQILLSPDNPDGELWLINKRTMN
jgi:hypothetical protein